MGYQPIPRVSMVENINVDHTPQVADPSAFAADKMLPLELIRVHTKTDDIPSVTDEQLDLYRRAAIEAAEQYTGMLLSGQKVQTEPVDTEHVSARAKMRGYYTHRTKYPVSDGVVHFYGSKDGYGNRTINVGQNAREVRVPLALTAIDLTSCCGGPCTSGAHNWGMQIMYRAGFADCEAIPAGIRLGMLKYVAWCITHPGDQYVSVLDRVTTRGGALQGTNNISWASGALELWRQYSPDAI